MKRREFLAAAARLAISFACALAVSLSAQVTPDRLGHADREPQNWLTYSGSYASQRYSLLDQITPANVKSLALKGPRLQVWLNGRKISDLTDDPTDPAEAKWKEAGRSVPVAAVR
jgi:hypothetical protein